LGIPRSSRRELEVSQPDEPGRKLGMVLAQHPLAVTQRFCEQLLGVRGPMPGSRTGRARKTHDGVRQGEESIQEKLSTRRLLGAGPCSSCVILNKILRASSSDVPVSMLQ